MDLPGARTVSDAETILTRIKSLQLISFAEDWAFLSLQWEATVGLGPLGVAAVERGTFCWSC